MRIKPRRTVKNQKIGDWSLSNVDLISVVADSIEHAENTYTVPKNCIVNNSTARAFTSVKKKRIALMKWKKEYRMLQSYGLRHNDFMIPKAHFVRIIKQLILSNTCSTVRRITGSALIALQVCCECYLITQLEIAQMLATHSNRVTLQHKDLLLLKTLTNSLNQWNE